MVKRKHKSGRPTVMTDAIIGKLEEVFLIGGTDAEACLFADIAMDTLYSYQLKNPTFADRKMQLKHTPTLAARREVVKGIKGSPNFALSYLERKAKDEFSTRQEVDSSIKLIDSSVKIALIEKLNNRYEPKRLNAGKSSSKSIRRRQAVSKAKA